MENGQQLFHIILGSYKDLEHVERPKRVFLQLFHIFPWSNTGQEHLLLPASDNQQLFHTIFRCFISICYILKEIHFPVNNFFTYLLGLKLVRSILQCLWICITSSFTHLLHTCQVHISIHMILFQQMFHLPLVFYSLLELVPMSVDLHLTASAHIYMQCTEI